MASHKFNTKGLPFVTIDEEGYLNLYTPEGLRVPCNIFLRVQDSIEGPNYVIAKFTCNIVGSLEEMREEIKKYNEN